MSSYEDLDDFDVEFLERIPVHRVASVHKRTPFRISAIFICNGVVFNGVMSKAARPCSHVGIDVHFLKCCSLLFCEMRHHIVV